MDHTQYNNDTTLQFYEGDLFSQTAPWWVCWSVIIQELQGSCYCDLWDIFYVLWNLFFGNPTLNNWSESFP